MKFFKVSVSCMAGRSRTADISTVVLADSRDAAILRAGATGLIASENFDHLKLRRFKIRVSVTRDIKL